MRRMTKAMLILSAAGLTAAAHAQDVRNEGAGSRRADLDRMIYQPAPVETILGASTWAGEKPSAADLSGKPVLVFTFAEWYRPSHSAAMLAKRLKEQNPDLVVIGVHASDGWDEASSFAEKRKLSFPIAKDEGGSIRDALKVDQDPDIYVIDRSGNMRYADITTDTAQAAVEKVVGEDMDQAANARTLIEQERSRERLESRRSGQINQNISLQNLPKIPFTAPTPEQYASTNWPKIDEELLENASSLEELTPPFTVPDGEWMNGKPDTEGKVIVAYIWHPAARHVMNSLMPKMESLHKQQGRDVAVMGFMMPVADERRNNRGGGGLITDEFRDIPITMEGMKRGIGSRQYTHSLMPIGGSPLPDVGDARRSRNNIDMLGRVIVVSSDGRVRRSVEDYREWASVQQAVDHLLRVDPGVRARREAERRYIQNAGN